MLFLNFFLKKLQKVKNFFKKCLLVIVWEDYKKLFLCSWALARAFSIIMGFLVLHIRWMLLSKIYRTIPKVVLLLRRDKQFSIQSVAWYCAESGISIQYAFLMNIFSKAGKKVHSHASGRKNARSVGCTQIIQKYNGLSLSVFPGAGEYSIRISFVEYQNGRTKQMVHGEQTIRIMSHRMLGNFFTSAVKLRYPQNKKVIGESSIFFEWKQKRSAFQYVLYVSQYPNPFYKYLYKIDKIYSKKFHFPSHQYHLQKKEKYYWGVQALDSIGNPIGGENGFSNVHSFHFGNQKNDDCHLIYPRKGHVVKSDFIVFRWNTISTGKHVYKVVLSKEKSFRNVILEWEGEEKSEMHYKSAFLQLQDNTQYYWKVVVLKKNRDTPGRNKSGVVFVPKISFF